MSAADCLAASLGKGGRGGYSSTYCVPDEGLDDTRLDDTRLVTITSTIKELT